MLRVNTTLQSLSLEWNHIGTDELGLASLASALEVNHTLLYLGKPLMGVLVANMMVKRKTAMLLHDHPASDQDDAHSRLKSFIICLKTRRCVWSDLRNNNITPDGAMVLARALKTNSALEVLVRPFPLSRSPLWVPDSPNSTTRHAMQDLRWNDIGETGAEALYHALASNRTLKEIHLKGNKLDESWLAKVRRSSTESRESHICVSSIRR
jgi:hypothetical protein